MTSSREESVKEGENGPCLPIIIYEVTDTLAGLSTNTNFYKKAGGSSKGGL
jgi:hypothetical protein